MLDHKYQQKKNKVKPKKNVFNEVAFTNVRKQKIKLLKNNKKLEH